MDVDNKNANTVASLALTSESFPSITTPQETFLTSLLEKGKDKEQSSQDAVVIPIITVIQPEEIIDDTVYKKIMRCTSFRAVMLYSNIKGKNKHNKFKTVCTQFGDLSGYARKVTQTIRRLTYMIVFFDSKDAITQAIITTFFLDDNYNYKYVPFQEIRQ